MSYITQVDEFIGWTIDNFYKSIVGAKKIDKIKKEKDFSKYQKEIDDLIGSYMKKIDTSSLKKLIKNEKNIESILDIVKRYIAYYTYMTIGFYQKDKNAYITNLIKCSEIHKEKVNNFYDSNNNAALNRFFDIIKYINELVNFDDVNKMEETVKNNPEKYKDTVEILNKMGYQYVVAHLKGDKPNNHHNIMKMIIFIELYLNQEKVIVFNILDSEELEKAEFKYIDIIVPRREYIDFSAIESLLDVRDRRRGVADDIYTMITDYETMILTRELSTEKKILELIDKRIIVPIVDDFLRYHKDSERYDKFVDKTKKKKDTKMRYIVTKMSKITEYYSDKIKNNKKAKYELEKLFFKPLEHRQATLINEVEELRIIDKMRNIGRSAIVGNELYADLLGYRLYPYINFKDYKYYGFQLRLNKTVNIIRYTNFRYKKSSRISIGNEHLQWRIGSENMMVNVVGLMIPTHKKQLYCVKVKDTDNIHDKNRNGYVGISTIIRDGMITNNPYSKIKRNRSAYWIFNLKSDNIFMDKYEEVDTLNLEDNSRFLVTKLYDDILRYTVDNLTNELKKRKPDSFYRSLQLVDKYENEFIYIPKYSEQYYRLQEVIYKDVPVTTEGGYDKNEDKIAGVGKKIIKLPIIKDKKEDKQIVYLGDVEEEVSVKIEESVYNRATCQHTITWNNISYLRKRNPNKFNQLLFEFIKKYVIINDEQDYICKSCNFLVDIKRFVASREYSDVIVINLAASVPLHEIAEYEKYSKSIQNIDKMIERICRAANILYYVGSLPEIKLRRQDVTKEMIDMILVHNKTLRSTDYSKRKERSITAQKVYGVQQNLSNFFLFELENSIFIYASKEVDKFKMVKLNNITTYIIFAIINQLNVSQIMQLHHDKICNYYLFERYGYTLFNDLFIRVNDKNDISPLKDYKLLCYIIFYLSCVITKYDIWHQQSEEPRGKKKYNIGIQRVIIHTLVDLINSILEVNTRKKKHYLYEVISTKFFVKLNTVYNVVNVLDRLKAQGEKRIVVDEKTKKIKFVTSSHKSIPLLGKVVQMEYPDEKRNDCMIKKYRIERVFKKRSSDEIIGKKKMEKLINTFKMSNYRKLAVYYDISGKRRKGLISEKELNKYKEKDFEKMKANIDKKKEIIMMDILKKNKEIEKLEEKKMGKYVKFEKKVRGEYEKRFNNIQEHINDFIGRIESITGRNVNINNQNIYLRYDTYIIDHDHHGNTRSSPVIIINRENIVKFRENDPFFKTDVLYYRDRSKKIDVYYDSINMNLIGYKELNKDYMKVERSGKYIKIILSFKSKLSYLGYKSMYMDVSNEIEEGIEEQDIVDDLVRNRIAELKNILASIQKVVYQIKFKYNKVDAPDIVKRYSKDIKFFKVKKYDKATGETKKLFKNWKLINENIFFKKSKDKCVKCKIKRGNISVNDLLRFPNEDNLIIYYILNEFEKMLSFNSDKYVRTQVAYLIINIIQYIYTLFFDAFPNIEVKKFSYLLEIESSYTDVEYKKYKLEEADDTQSYDEFLANKNREDMNVERSTAIDADQDVINQEFGDEEQIIEMNYD